MTKVLGNEGQSNPERIPVSLLKGLNELVKASKKSDILTNLFENSFP